MQKNSKNSFLCCFSFKFLVISEDKGGNFYWSVVGFSFKSFLSVKNTFERYWKLDALSLQPGAVGRPLIQISRCLHASSLHACERVSFLMLGFLTCSKLFVENVWLPLYFLPPHPSCTQLQGLGAWPNLP